MNNYIKTLRKQMDSARQLSMFYKSGLVLIATGVVLDGLELTQFAAIAALLLVPTIGLIVSFWSTSEAKTA